MPADKPIKSCVRQHRGRPVLFLDDTPDTGLMFWHSKVQTAGPDVARFSGAGIRLFTFGASMEPAWKSPDAPDFSGLDQAIEQLIEAAPDVLLMPRFYLEPPVDWKARHPDQITLHLDASNGDEFRDRVSTSSAKFWDDVRQPLAAFVRHCERRWSDRIFAYHPCMGDCGEFAYSWKTVISDLSQPQTEAFRRFLQDRYPSDAALRDAWHDESVSLDTASVPDHTQRRRAPGQPSLLDPATTDRGLIDYLEFHSRAMAEAMCRSCELVKSNLRSLGREKVVGVFGGYVFFPPHYPHARHNSGHAFQDPLLEHPDVDFIAAPESYQERHAGGMFLSQLLPASIRLHGKLAWSEDDTFTHLAKKTPWRYCCRDAADTAHVLWRNTIGALTNGITKWFMDHDGDGWYRDDNLMEQVRQMRLLADRQLDRDFVSAAQIAVIVDEHAIGFQRHDESLSDAMLCRQASELSAIGAPYDAYRWNDLHLIGNPSSYKLWIFLSCHRTNDAQTDRVRRLLAASKGHALWVSPAGVIGEAGFDLGASASLTGVSIRPLARSGHPTIETFITGERITWHTDGEIGPLYAAEDGPALTVHGWLLDRGEPALVSTRIGERTSWWCAVPGISATVLRTLARQAGVHIYCDSGDQILAGDVIIALHGRSTGPRTILIPRPHLPPTEHHLEVRRGETYRISTLRHPADV